MFSSNQLACVVPLSMMTVRLRTSSSFWIGLSRLHQHIRSAPSICVREVDDPRAVRRDPKCGDQKVDAARLQLRDAVLGGDAGKLRLVRAAECPGCHLPRHIDLHAGKAAVRAAEAVGRLVATHPGPKHALRTDCLGKRRQLLRERRSRQAHREEQGRNDSAEKRSCYVSFGVCDRGGTYGFAGLPARSAATSRGFATKSFA